MTPTNALPVYMLCAVPPVHAQPPHFQSPRARHRCHSKHHPDADACTQGQVVPSLVKCWIHHSVEQWDEDDQEEDVKDRQPRSWQLSRRR